MGLTGISILSHSPYFCLRIKGQKRTGCSDLHLGLPLGPPRLHHRRQFLPHGCTHRLATGCLLGGRRSLLRRRLAFPFCPTLFHRCRDTLTCCRAHTATFLDTRWLSLASLGRTTTPYGLGT